MLRRALGISSMGKRKTLGDFRGGILKSFCPENKWPTPRWRNRARRRGTGMGRPTAGAGPARPPGVNTEEGKLGVSWSVPLSLLSEPPTLLPTHFVEPPEGEDGPNQAEVAEAGKGRAPSNVAEIQRGLPFPLLEPKDERDQGLRQGAAAPASKAVNAPKGTPSGRRAPAAASPEGSAAAAPQPDHPPGPPLLSSGPGEDSGWVDPVPDLPRPSYSSGRRGRAARTPKQSAFRAAWAARNLEQPPGGDSGGSAAGCGVLTPGHALSPPMARKERGRACVRVTLLASLGPRPARGRHNIGGHAHKGRSLLRASLMAGAGLLRLEGVKRTETPVSLLPFTFTDSSSVRLDLRKTVLRPAAGGGSKENISVFRQLTF